MNRELNNQKFQETFNKHKSLLNETLNLNNEIGASYGEPVSGMNEGTPPGFPKDIKAKIIKQYGETPKAYATMWTLHKKLKNKLEEMLDESKENRACSYCQKELNIKPEEGQTHGMCKRHAKKFMSFLGKSAEEFDKMDPKLFCPDLKK